MIRSVFVNDTPSDTPSPLTGIVEYSYDVRSCLSGIASGLVNELGDIDYSFNSETFRDAQDRPIRFESDWDYDGSVEGIVTYFYEEIPGRFIVRTDGSVYMALYNQGQQTTCLTD